MARPFSVVELVKPESWKDASSAAPPTSNLASGDCACQPDLWPMTRTLGKRSNCPYNGDALLKQKSATGRFRSWSSRPKADVGLQAGKWSRSTSTRGGTRTISEVASGMDTVRGLSVWLAPPLLASLLCTAVWQIAWGHPTYWGPLVAVGVVSLLFTIAGSTLLMLAFARMSAWANTLRYLVLVLLGVGAGGAVMLLVSGPSPFALAGAAYGGTTAGLWALFHRAIYGRG